MVLELSAGHGTHGGVLFIEGRRWENNPTLRCPFPVENQKRHRIVVRTHLDADTAEFSIDWDEVKNFITWKGPSAALTNVEDQFWNLSMIRRPWLVAGVGNVTFENSRIRMRNGTIRRDSITDADLKQDLKSGFVRLVGQPVSSMRVGDWTPILVNQMPPLSMVRGDVERTWPLITRDFAICQDYYGAHAPSRVVCDIPAGAKCFTAIGYNDSSWTTRYLVSIDGKSVFDSGITGIVIAKVDIPAKASLLELVIDHAGDGELDHTYWCYPRFHSTTSDKIDDKMLDGKTGTLKFQVKSSTVGHGTLTRNQPISLSIPIHFRHALPCDEFLWAHAPSAVTYNVPNGMNRFTAIGYCAQSRHVNFEVWANQKLLYQSPQAGIIPIDTKLPPGTSKLELKINNLGDSSSDRSMWCYPRLHRK